jgi:hypothetical protein
VTPGSTPDNPSTSPSAWRSSFGPDAFAQTPARCPHGLRGADHGGPDRPDLDEHRFGDNANANHNVNVNVNANANHNHNDNDNDNDNGASGAAGADRQQHRHP